MIKRIFVVVLVSFIIIFFAGSKGLLKGENNIEKKEDNRIYTLGEVLVIDTKDQQGTMSIITKKDVEHSTQQNAINTVNEHVPAFYTNNNRVFGFGVAGSGSAKMSIRGIGVSGWGPTTGMAMLINGINTSTPVAGHPIADIFTMKNIERIEVLHGPQPVLYGSGAMGGVINIITAKQRKNGFKTVLSASYGSYNSTEDYVFHKGKIKNFDYSVSYDYRYSDGHRTEKVDGITFDSVYWSHNSTLHLGYKISPELYLTVDSFAMKMKVNDPGPLDLTAADASSVENFYINRAGASIGLKNNFKKLKGLVQIYGNWGHHLSQLPYFNDNSKWELKEKEYVVKIMETYTLSSSTSITGGAEYRYYGGNADNPSYPSVGMQEVYVDDKYMNDVSLFGLVKQKFVKDRVILSVGGRYTNNSEFGSFGSWQAGAVAHVTDDLKIFINSARGFRLPEIRQYYLSFAPADKPLSVEDVKLDPEKYTSIEGGFEYNFKKFLQFTFTGYRIYSKDKFIKTGTFPDMVWGNAPDYNYSGLETKLSMKPVKTLKVNLGYSYIDNKNGSVFLPYVPRHKVAGQVLFEKGAVCAGVSTEYINTIWADSAGSVELDNYLLVNTKVSYIFLKRYQAFIVVRNITDNDYEIFEGYPMPGRHVMGGVKATF